MRRCAPPRKPPLRIADSGAQALPGARDSTAGALSHLVLLGVVVGLVLGTLGGIGALTARGRWRYE